MNSIRLVTRYPVRSTAAALVLVAALCAALVWMASGQLIHPFWHEPGLEPVGPEDIAYETWSGVQHPSELALAYEDVEFSAVDGDTLRGWWIPLEGARGAVVTVHGGRSDRRDFVRHVPFLHRAGFSVLLFDCREHGRSDGRGRGISGGYRESEDVSSAVSFLAERGVDHVSVLGTSQGASSALIAAARDPRIRAVVAENPVASLDTLVRKTAIIEQLNLPELLLAAIPRVAFSRIGARGGGWEALDLVSEVSPTPILFIHGLADVVTPPYHTELLMEAANEPKAVWWVPDGEHMRLYNRAPEEYEQRVVEFLDVALVIDICLKNAILPPRGVLAHAPEGIRRGVGCAAPPRAQAVGRGPLAQRSGAPHRMPGQFGHALARSASPSGAEGLRGGDLSRAAAQVVAGPEASAGPAAREGTVGPRLHDRRLDL